MFLFGNDGAIKLDAFQALPGHQAGIVQIALVSAHIGELRVSSAVDIEKPFTLFMRGYRNENGIS
jgi:hypothetical protein